MPAATKKEGSKYRVVEADSGNIVTKDGNPVDGGGHASKAEADRQARAINASQRANDRRA